MPPLHQRRSLIIGPAFFVIAWASVSPMVAATPTEEPSTSPALAEPVAPTECRPATRLSMAGLKGVAHPWIDALWSFHETGDDTRLTGHATERGLARLKEVDWRSAAVDRDGARFEEQPEIIEFNDWQEWCIDGTQLVALDVEPIIRIGPGARTLDAVRGTPIEAAQGEQLRAIGLSFTHASDADG